MERRATDERTPWTRARHARLVVCGVVTAAACFGCAASQPRYHYAYSLNGGAMRGLEMGAHRAAHEDSRQAAR